jgi:hypothetical protein
MKSLLAALLLATACTSSGTGTGGDPSNPWGDGTGTPDNPIPQAPDKGPYAVETKIDLTVEAILPAQAELVVATLRDFSTNPAHALITAASNAGVPALGTLYGLIPGALKSQLEGWINGEINKVKIAGQPLTTYAGDVATLADTALTQFAVDSTLGLAPSGATQTLTAIDFSPAGIDVKFAIPGLVGDLLTQTPSVTLGAAGALGIGDEHFGLNYGEYAWQGINLAVKAEFGTDIHDTVSKALNCPHIAQAVANQCILGVCVGHATELTSVCQGGLDALVDGVHSQFSALRFDVLHFAAGQAHLVDDDQDGVADRIVDGSWTAEMNLGMGLRHTPATFTGTR